MPEIRISDGEAADINHVEVAPAPKATRAAKPVPEGHVQTTTKTVIRPAKDPVPVKPKLTTTLDIQAAQELTNVECERVGPGSGPGWDRATRTYQGREVFYGRLGKLPNDDNQIDAAQARFGGGEVEFSGLGADGLPKKYRMVFGGPPLGADNVPEDAASIGIYGDGFVVNPGYRPGDGSPMFAPPPGYGGGYPASQPDQYGFVQPSEDAPASQGMTGWVWLHAFNRWKWFGPGIQPGAPPPLPGSGAGGGFNPSLYDHSRRPEEDRMDKLEKMLEKLADRAANPPADPMAGFVAMMAAQNSSDKLRWEKENAEANRRWEAEKVRLQAQQGADREVALARIAADKEIATAKAASDKAVAEAMAKSQTESQKLLIETIKSANPLGAVKQLSEAIGMPLFGGNSNSEGVEVAKVVNEGVQAGVRGIAEIVSVWKGQGGGTPSTSGLAPADQQAWDYYRLLGLMLKCMDQGVPATEMPRNFGVACITLGLDIGKTTTALRLATPELIAAQIEKQIAGKEVSETIKAQTQAAKDKILSAEGRAWFAAFKTALAGGAPPAPALPDAGAAGTGAAGKN